RAHGLGFIPLAEEQYDFAVPEARLARAPVQAFRDLLASDAAREALRDLGFTPAD
ncbi:MAG: substrate-binding domain-containing protein, partial [Acetobacteraceae bacterium]